MFHKHQAFLGCLYSICRVNGTNYLFLRCLSSQAFWLENGDIWRIWRSTMNNKFIYNKYCIQDCFYEWIRREREDSEGIGNQHELYSETLTNIQVRLCQLLLNKVFSYHRLPDKHFLTLLLQQSWSRSPPCGKA